MRNPIDKQFLTMFLMFLILVTSFSGATLIKNQSYSRFNPAIVEISIENLGTIIDNDFSIIEVNEDSFLIFSTSEEINWLEEQNLNPKILYNDYFEMNGWNKNPFILDDFTTYTELTSELQNIESNYPSISKLYNLGTSVQGRTIWGLKITDNPTIEENEAEVRICGCHHGNEIMSVELPLLLAWHLVDNYASDPYIEDLVDNREIWIIPMVNPDGRTITSRYNANGIDLNRDYGYLWGGEGGSPAPFSQPETQAIREHALDNNFVLSLSFHTTAKYINYIWNYKGQPVADNAVVVYLSNMYGTYNDYVVVEGYDWYQTRGDTNDFSYGCRGDLDWTIETENSNIPYVWNKNREGMLDLIEAADMGLTGVVTNADTGDPISATIWIEEVYWPCFTDPKIGDYHKPLLPGTYNVIVRANGYAEQNHQVVITFGSPTILDISLTPEDTIYAEQVTICNFYDPYSYPNNFQNNPTEGIYALGPFDNICASLGKGGYIVLDMGEEGVITDHEDSVDFKIFEGDGSDDGYYVHVSSNWNGPWINLGLATGTTDFDLNNYSVEEARFIKIVDDNDGSATETNPGADIDCVKHIIPFVNNPPEAPDIDGPSSGKPEIEYDFTFTTTDPEEDDVYYYITWDDGHVEPWIGPYESGEIVTISHEWMNKGKYTIEANAKDIHDEESPMGQFIVNMPRDKTISSLFLRFLDNFHFLQQIMSFIL
jgi:hypothetical protein